MTIEARAAEAEENIRRAHEPPEPSLGGGSHERSHLEFETVRAPTRQPSVAPASQGEHLNNPRLNKGSAFTEKERDAFALHGLLPPHQGTLEEQVKRRRKPWITQPTNFHKYSFMRDLEDTNETVFYSLIAHNIEELLPIVYTRPSARVPAFQ